MARDRSLIYIHMSQPSLKTPNIMLNRTSNFFDSSTFLIDESSQGINLRPLLPPPRCHPVGTNAGHRTAAPLAQRRVSVSLAYGVTRS